MNRMIVFVSLIACSLAGSAQFANVRAQLRTFPDARAEGGTLYLTVAEWNGLSGVQQDRVKAAFYRDLLPVAEELSERTGIPVSIFAMIAAKESLFGASFLAQYAMNPTGLRTAGKEALVGWDGTESRLYTDAGETVPFLKFRAIENGLLAFAWTIARPMYGLGADQRAELRRSFQGIGYRSAILLDEDTVIDALVRAGFAQKNGARKDYEAWLEAVRDRM